MSAVGFGVVGVGGFGKVHLDALQHLEAGGRARIVGVAEPNQELHRDALGALRARGVRVYESVGRLLDAETGVEAVAIPAPLYLHPSLAIQCLNAGKHVFVEKPPAVTPEDIRAMLEAQRRSGKMAAVGFQQISQAHLRMLKRRIIEGELGRIEHVVGVGRWRRLDAYYARNDWAGKVRVGDRWVLDGPLNNPLSHLVNDLLFLAGQTMNGFARPMRVRGELYRAHPIEGEDTSCVTAQLEGGTTLCCTLTVCGPEEEAPWAEVFGTEGHARWTLDGHLRLRSKDGKTQEPPLPADPGGTTRTMLENFVAALGGQEKLLCPLEATEPFVLTSAGAYESAGRIVEIPEEFVRRYPEDASTATEVADIVGITERAAAARGTFSDIGVPWARRTRWFELEGYKRFSGIEAG